MKHTFVILPENHPESEWDRQVAMLPCSNLFHTSDWLGFTREYFNLHPQRTLIYRDKEIVGILPFFTKKFLLLEVAGSPLFAENNPYMGWSLKKGVDVAQLLLDFDHFLRNRKIDFIRISYDSEMHARQFRKAGYAVKERKSFRLDLDVDRELLWKGIGAKTRNMVRKAEKNGFFFGAMSEEAFLEHYYSMSISVYERQRIVPILDRSYYDALLRYWKKKKNFHLFAVTDSDGQPVAAAIILSYDGKAYYLDGVSYRNRQIHGVNNFLQWNIIGKLKETGIRQYDMLGGDMEGIAQFKKSFGTINHPCSYVEKAVSPIARFSKTTYAQIKKLKSKATYYYANRINN